MGVTGLDGSVRDRSPRPRLPVVGLLRALETLRTAVEEAADRHICT
jgi:hypothetical protein